MAVAARAEGQPLRRIPRLSVASWVLYDLANTIFSLAIVSRYFSVWAIQEMGGTDQQYATANNISTLLMILAAPVLGALSDRASRRKPFLVVTTLLCVGFTLLLGTGGCGPPSPCSRSPTSSTRRASSSTTHSCPR